MPKTNVTGGSMKQRIVGALSVLACLMVAAVAFSQADPLSGTWAGDWGPSAQDRNQVTVDLKLDGKAVSGVVKTENRQEVKLSNSSFDATTRTVKMEAEAQSRGQTIKYVIEGKLEGTTMTGSWNHDGRKGDFKLTKK